MEQERLTKGERRDRKRRKRGRMGMSGTSVRRLQQIILEKSRNKSRHRK